MSRVLRSNAILTEGEERALARHIYAVEWHIHRILDLLSGKALVKWQDYLIKMVNQRALGKLRCALDSDWRHAFPSPYYGDMVANSLEECPMIGRSIASDPSLKVGRPVWARGDRVGLLPRCRDLAFSEHPEHAGHTAVEVRAALGPVSGLVLFECSCGATLGIGSPTAARFGLTLFEIKAILGRRIPPRRK